MKSLVLGSLFAAVVSQAAGCVISSDDDAVITATWRFENAASGTETGCPSGFDTAAVYSQPVNSLNQPVGSPIIDLFDCVDGIGSTAPLPPDVYQVWVEITSGSGGSVYAQSVSAIVDVVSSDKTFNATILNDGGYFALSWELFDAQTNAPLECSTAGSQGVSVLSTSVANQSSFVDDVFTCEDHYGVTGGLLAGAYTVAVSALGAGDASIGQAPVLTNKLIGVQNDVTDLGTINIPIE